MTTSTTSTTSKAWTDQLGSFAAILAQYTGHVSNWLHVVPSLEKAQAAYDALPPELQRELADRAANHGMEAAELIQKMPEVLWDNPTAMSKWLDLVDISHVEATSVAPELQSDSSNWTWEMRGTNRARGAETMSGEEYRAANENSRDAARDFTNENWWDLNDLFHKFLDAAEALGYSAAWLPKELWLKMMNGIKHEIPKIWRAKGFASKLKAAREFGLRIKRFFIANGHHMATSFMLGVLTLAWPPAAFFMGAWALTGLGAIATQVLYTLVDKAASRGRFMRLMFNWMKTPLAAVNRVLQRCRNIIDNIKNGLFYASSLAVDFIWKHTKNFVDTVVKPAVKTVIQKAKNSLAGFLGWCMSIFK